MAWDSHFKAVHSPKSEPVPPEPQKLDEDVLSNHREEILRKIDEEEHAEAARLVRECEEALMKKVEEEELTLLRVNQAVRALQAMFRGASDRQSLAHQLKTAFSLEEDTLPIKSSRMVQEEAELMKLTVLEEHMQREQQAEIESIQTSETGLLRKAKREVKSARTRSSPEGLMIENLSTSGSVPVLLKKKSNKRSTSRKDIYGMCSRDGCEKLATKSQCRACFEEKLTPTYFCSEECGALAWDSHSKSVHPRISEPSIP